VFTGGTITYRAAEWSFTNYQAGLVYKPTARIQPLRLVRHVLDAAGHRGRRPEQQPTTARATWPRQLEPEDSESFEAGAKATSSTTRWPCRRRCSRPPARTPRSRSLPGFYAQVGETEVKGFELGFSGNITPKWQVFGGYTYMDSELVRGAYTGGGVNQGDPLANTPKHTFSSFTTYRVTRALSLGGGAYYVSTASAATRAGRAAGQPGLRPGLLALRRLRLVDRQRQGRPAAERPEPDDERYIARTNGVHHADPAPGRQAILTLNVKY
jgi:catecholate siderophore receptor